MGKVIIGLYDRFEDGQAAVSELVSAGFLRDKISLVAADIQGKLKEYVGKTGENIQEGTATGVGIGPVVDGLGSLLTDLGTYVIPGIGPVLAAGPIVSAQIVASDGTAKGIIGALIDLGVPEEHAHCYAESVRRGCILVTVNTVEERSDEAVQILNRHHPIDIDKRVTIWRSENWSRFDPCTRPFTLDDYYREWGRNATEIDPEAGKLEVVDEEFQVGIGDARQERMRIHTFVTENPRF